MLKNNDISCFKPSYFVIILLINVKIPTIGGTLTFYEQDEFHAQLR